MRSAYQFSITFCCLPYACPASFGQSALLPRSLHNWGSGELAGGHPALQADMLAADSAVDSLFVACFDFLGGLAVVLGDQGTVAWNKYRQELEFQ